MTILKNINLTPRLKIGRGVFYKSNHMKTRKTNENKYYNFTGGMLNHFFCSVLGVYTIN